MQLKGWNYKDNSLILNHKTKDFSEALSLLVKIGIEAEKSDHHPDMLLYSWNNIKITLSTHSEGGVTDKDFELAEKINNLL